MRRGSEGLHDRLCWASARASARLLRATREVLQGLLIGSWEALKAGLPLEGSDGPSERFSGLEAWLIRSSEGPSARLLTRFEVPPLGALFGAFSGPSQGFDREPKRARERSKTPGAPLESSGPSQGSGRALGKGPRGPPQSTRNKNKCGVGALGGPEKAPERLLGSSEWPHERL